MQKHSKRTRKPKLRKVRKITYAIVKGMEEVKDSKKYTVTLPNGKTSVREVGIYKPAITYPIKLLVNKLNGTGMLVRNPVNTLMKERSSIRKGLEKGLFPNKWKKSFHNDEVTYNPYEQAHGRIKVLTNLIIELEKQIADQKEFAAKIKATK